MFAHFKGIISDKDDEIVIIDVNDIGYNICVGKSTAASLNVGESVKLYTHTAVREDDISVYGFLTKKELDFFKLLITVNGVGAKFALNILSILSVEQAALAIISNDSKTLSAANGIGAKTAQRIILDLKDKVDSFTMGDVVSADASSSADCDSAAKREAVDALVSLGYSRANAYKAVSMVTDVPEGTDSETYLKLGLKNIFIL